MQIRHQLFSTPSNELTEAKNILRRSDVVWLTNAIERLVLQFVRGNVFGKQQRLPRGFISHEGSPASASPYFWIGSINSSFAFVSSEHNQQLGGFCLALILIKSVSITRDWEKPVRLDT
jgi:hypothetical protein